MTMNLNNEKEIRTISSYVTHNLYSSENKHPEFVVRSKTMLWRPLFAYLEQLFDTVEHVIRLGTYDYYDN